MPECKPLAQMVSLSGRKALVTGAASGIGRAIARRFSEAGAQLTLLDLDGDGLHATRDELVSGDIVHSIVTVDLSEKDQIDSFWQEHERDPPDILVNNAGIYPGRRYVDVDEEFLTRILDTNLNSVFWMCQHFVKSRGAKGGIIVNMSSVEAVQAFKTDMAHYSMAKSAVMALTRSLARDYGRMGFRTNAILPGAVGTPGTKSLIRSGIRRLDLGLVKTAYHYQSRLASGRWGTADEVARVALFLASDLAEYVQGAMIPVDGGFLSM